MRMMGRGAGGAGGQIFNIGKSKAKFYIKIYNVGNLIDDSWGQVNDAEFFTVPAVRAHVNDAGQYVFDRFEDGAKVTYLRENRSLWDIRMGLEINF